MQSQESNGISAGPSTLYTVSENKRLLRYFICTLLSIQIFGLVFGKLWILSVLSFVGVCDLFSSFLWIASQSDAASPNVFLSWSHRLLACQHFLCGCTRGNYFIKSCFLCHTDYHRHLSKLWRIMPKLYNAPILPCLFLSMWWEHCKFRWFIEAQQMYAIFVMSRINISALRVLSS